MSRVLMCLAPGFEEIEAVTVIDILRRAEIPVTVAGLERGMITGSHYITVKCDAFIEDLDYSDFDMLVLPGGQPGTNNLKNNYTVISMVKKFKDNGKFIAAICAAPTVLEKAGVIEKIHITSYPSEKSVFNHTNYIESNVVKDGTIITSRGVGTALDFALELVEILKGQEIKKDLADKILWRATSE